MFFIFIRADEDASKDVASFTARCFCASTMIGMVINQRDTFAGCSRQKTTVRKEARTHLQHVVVIQILMTANSWTTARKKARVGFCQMAVSPGGQSMADKDLCTICRSEQAATSQMPYDEFCIFGFQPLDESPDLARDYITSSESVR